MEKMGPAFSNLEGCTLYLLLDAEADEWGESEKSRARVVIRSAAPPPPMKRE